MKKEDKKSGNFIDVALERLMNGADKQVIKTELKEWFADEYKLPIKKDIQKIITFGNATLLKLEEIVNIKQADNENKFDEWFSYKYELSEEEEFYLNKLIKKNKLYLSAYNEAQLKAKFITLVLDKVDFFFDDVKDWYEYPLSAMVNNVLFGGKPDFMVAKGNEFPKKPYFFIQEFKPAERPKKVKDQLLAAMLVAMQINKVNNLSGCYIIGRMWFFLILEKLENGDYEYFVHEGLNCLKFNDLKQIYINLQAVKNFIKSEAKN